MPWTPEHVRNQNRGTFVDSARGFATLLALAVTLFATPLLWQQLEPTLWGWLIRLYGGDLAWWLYWGLKLGAYGIVFYGLRMSLVTSLVAGATLAAVRFV